MPRKPVAIAVTVTPEPEERKLAETRNAESKIDVTRLRRKKDSAEDIVPREEPVSVSAGAVEKALDLAFNPTREKLPEVTIIDKFQGRLFPLITLINIIWGDVLQIALYRQDKEEYKRIFKKPRPVSGNWLDELLHSTAQWQKSIGGANLTKITDIALAETETRAGEDEGGIGGGVDAWGKE